MNGFNEARKGDIYTAITADTTANSTEYNITGYNAALLSAKFTSAATWRLDIKGRMDTAGTTMDIYDNNDNQLTTGNITANRTKLFVALPNYITIYASLVDGTATLTARMQPINI
jgi:hypothetical protein